MVPCACNSLRVSGDRGAQVLHSQQRAEVNPGSIFRGVSQFTTHVIERAMWPDGCIGIPHHDEEVVVGAVIYEPVEFVEAVLPFSRRVARGGCVPHNEM